MAIIRDEIHETEYLKVHNSTINSYDSLSIEAMGSLIYWLSKPAGWQPSVSELAKTWGFGREKAQRIMKELKEAGYVKKSQARSIKGQFVTTELHVLETPRKGSDLQVTLPDNVVAMGVVDNPAHGETRKSGNPSTGNPFTGKPSTEKQATINNRSLEITERRNNREKKPPTKVNPLEFVINDQVDANAWREWWEYKGKKTVGKATVSKTANQMARFTPAQQQNMVDYSIRGEYPALYDNQAGKDNGHRSKQGNQQADPIEEWSKW